MKGPPNSKFTSRQVSPSRVSPNPVFERVGTMKKLAPLKKQDLQAALEDAADDGSSAIVSTVPS